MRRILLLTAISACSVLLFGCDDDGSGGAGGSGASGGAGGSATTTDTSAGGTGGGATTTTTAGGAGGGTTTTTTTATECGEDTSAPDEVLEGVASDPEAGDFTLDEALAGLPEGPGPLRAILETDFGTLTCELFPNEAPIGVANFVGLARGTRAWKDPAMNKWVKRRYYDGLTFHRIIDNFVIQGGDPLGTGYGGPGYKFKNEIAGLTHLAGTMAYANAGANTNGSQFYICETPQSGLDSGYTIFGQCEPVSVVSDIAAVETDVNDKPITPVVLKRVSITRCAP